VSLLHPVTARSCSSCGYRWFAESGHSRSRPGPLLFSAGINSARTYRRGKYEQWHNCTQCGSTKVRTVSKRGFVPSAAAMHGAPAVVVNVGVPAYGQPPQAPQIQEAQPIYQLPSQQLAMPSTPPDRQLPGDDSIKRAFAATRPQPLNLGDHVHTPQCVEGGCRLLDQTAHDPDFKDFARAAMVILAGIFIVWPLQYGVVTPLVGLRYAARTSAGRLWGVLGVVCGLGVGWSLAYIGMTQVPRVIMTPWGLYVRQVAPPE
jgi:hypothetical protein